MGGFCFGSDPRPKADPFWHRPYMPRFWNRGRMKKLIAAKSPSDTSAKLSQGRT